jgi:uncharacterized protein YjbI with pentapeptide repeats
MNVAIHQILSPWPIGIIAAGILLWWLIPWTLASVMPPKSNSRQRYEENLRTNIARTLTGMSVAVGFFVTIWQTNRTEQLATETRILDQYQKATETLGKNDYRIHSGAISTLIEAARLRPELRRGSIVQLAQAALVYSGDPQKPSPQMEGCVPNVENALISPDAQAALTGLATRPFLQDNVSIVLRKGRFRGASLPWAFLNDTDLGGTDLSGSDLYGAHLYQANLRFANLNGANLSGADLSNAGLEGASICPGANYAVPALQGKPQAASVAGAALYSANLDRVHFDQANLSLSVVGNASAIEAHFSGSKLYETKFDNSNLSNADFQHADGTCVQFRNGTDLSDANFDDATLSRAMFDHVILRGARFSRANLADANFRGSSVDRESVEGAILCRTVWIDGTILHADCDSPPSKDCEVTPAGVQPWEKKTYHDFEQ